MTGRISIPALREQADGRPHSAIRRAQLLALVEAVEALRYMAEYRMVGNERTLHIDFQAKARAALARFDFGEDT